MKRVMNRRRFLAAGGTGAAAAALPVSAFAADVNGESHSYFQHGVASGDPLSDGIILWTRVTPAQRTDSAIDVATLQIISQPSRGTVEVDRQTAETSSCR